jgi:hypothetical protein
VLSWYGPLWGLSINVDFDIISPIRGQRKMPSERSSADTIYLLGLSLAITVCERVAFATRVIHCAGTTTSGRSFDDRVRATFCLEKHDGAWRIAHQHVSIPAQDN